MRNGAFYDELQFLATKIMYDKFGENYKSWRVIDTYSDNSGVQICTYEQNKLVLFVIRGTDVNFTFNSLQDFKADFAILKKKIPNQYEKAEKFFLANQNKYKNCIFVGYSLGGSLAQMLGAKYGNETITYNALSTGDIHGTSHNVNIINFGNTLDCFFIYEVEKHIGDIFISPVTEKKELYPFKLPTPYYHITEKGVPSKAVKFNSKEYTNFVKQSNKYLQDRLIKPLNKKIDFINSKVKEQTTRVLNKHGIRVN